MYWTPLGQISTARYLSDLRSKFDATELEGETSISSKIIHLMSTQLFVTIPLTLDIYSEVAESSIPRFVASHVIDMMQTRSKSGTRFLQRLIIFL
jgi:hypothetical protein